MDAPTYPPAVAFEQPTEVPYEFSIETATLADLMSSPAAWAIVVKHAPAFKFMVDTPQLKPHLDSMRVKDFIVFGTITQKAVDDINAELRLLPRSDWPKP